MTRLYSYAAPKLSQVSAASAIGALRRLGVARFRFRRIQSHYQNDAGDCRRLSRLAFPGDLRFSADYYYSIRRYLPRALVDYSIPARKFSLYAPLPARNTPLALRYESIGVRHYELA